MTGENEWTGRINMHIYFQNFKIYESFLGVTKYDEFI